MLYTFTQTRSLQENTQHIKYIFYNYRHQEKMPYFKALMLFWLSSISFHFSFLCPQFNPASPLSPADSDFVNEPSPNDKAHCLVSVVPANSISQMTNEVFQKMKNVWKEALRLGELLKDVIYNNVTCITLLYLLFYICWFVCNI